MYLLYLPVNKKKKEQSEWQYFAWVYRNQGHKKLFFWCLETYRSRAQLTKYRWFFLDVTVSSNGSLISGPTSHYVYMLKARWHLGYLDRVPVLPPHQLQPLWLPYVPKEQQNTRCMSVMSWLKVMLVFTRGTAEVSHWRHGMLAIMEHEGEREDPSFSSSGMRLHNVTSSGGEVSQISTVQLPTLLDSWNTGGSDAGKGPPSSPPSF